MDRSQRDPKSFAVVVLRRLGPVVPCSHRCQLSWHKTRRKVFMKRLPLWSRVTVLTAGIFFARQGCAGSLPPLPLQVLQQGYCKAAEYHQFDFWVGDWEHSRSEAQRRLPASRLIESSMAVSYAKTTRTELDTRGRALAFMMKRETCGTKAGLQIEVNFS